MSAPPALPALPDAQELAHRELRIRIVLEQADIELNLLNAAALLSIAVESFATHPRAGFLALMGDLFDVARAGALARGETPL